MRKSYTRAERGELIAAVTMRGEPVAAAAARLGVGVATAYDWVRAAKGRGRGSPKRRRDGGDQGPQPTFARLVPAGAGTPLVVRAGGAKIEVRAGFDGALLRAVVAALHGGES